MELSRLIFPATSKTLIIKKMREVLKNEKLREPNEIEPPCIAAMQEVAADRIRWFGADGKAGLYR